MMLMQKLQAAALFAATSLLLVSSPFAAAQKQEVAGSTVITILPERMKPPAAFPRMLCT